MSKLPVNSTVVVQPVGVSGLAGTLFYDSEDTLLSAENDFYMVTISIGFAVRVSESA